MRITGTRSQIEIEIDGKIVKIDGEMVVGGFAAYKSSIKKWESPNDAELIDDAAKEKIIRDVEDYTRDSHMVIIFE